MGHGIPPVRLVVGIRRTLAFACMIDRANSNFEFCPCSILIIKSCFVMGISSAGETRRGRGQSRSTTNDAYRRAELYGSCFTILDVNPDPGARLTRISGKGDCQPGRRSLAITPNASHYLRHPLPKTSCPDHSPAPSTEEELLTSAASAWAATDFAYKYSSRAGRVPHPVA